MYVISTSDQAVAVGHVTPISVGGQHLMQWFPPAGKPQWSYVHITSLEEWRMEECVACPPATVKLLSGGGRPRGIMATIPKQASMPLLKFAANRGFKGMAAVRMLDLAKLLELPCHRCNEFESTEALIRHVFPAASDAEVAVMLARRTMKREAKYEVTVTREASVNNVDLLGEELREALADVDEYGKQVQAVKPATPAPKKGAARTKKKRGATDHLLAEVARKYLPNVP